MTSLRTAELLAASPSGGASTRAVSEAVGITQPILYLHFGDKGGLLSAVVYRMWAQYLEGKSAEHVVNLAAVVPLERLGSADDSAEIASFLA